MLEPRVREAPSRTLCLSQSKARSPHPTPPQGPSGALACSSCLGRGNSTPPSPAQRIHRNCLEHALSHCFLLNTLISLALSTLGFVPVCPGRNSPLGVAPAKIPWELDPALGGICHREEVTAEPPCPPSPSLGGPSGWGGKFHFPRHWNIYSAYIDWAPTVYQAMY